MRRYVTGLVQEESRIRQQLKKLGKRIREAEQRLEELKRQRAELRRELRKLQKKLNSFLALKPGEIWIDNKTSLKLCVEFLKEHASVYDLSRAFFYLRWMRRDAKEILSGTCKYPPKGTRNRPYSLVCRVKKYVQQPFPITIEWAVSTRPCEGGYEYIYKKVTCNDLEDVMSLVIGHELFHYLRRTKQVPGRNTQTQANAFGIRWLEEFQKWREERLAQSKTSGA